MTINPNILKNEIFIFDLDGTIIDSESVMIRCLEISEGDHPEDFFFSNSVFNLDNAKLADYEIANKFSQEIVYSEDPFCGHQFWLSNIKNKKLINLEDSEYFEYLNSNSTLHSNLYY